ncbi:MAG: isocitrate lyase/PEP mutase family protein [Rhodovibrionaceae bacterium]
MSERKEARRRLRGALEERRALVAPGVFDMISAKIADALGFEALYMTGFGISASHLGLPDAGLASYTEMLERVARLAEGCATPLIADGDTGYGGALNVQRTVRGYERAGAAAIQLEDQLFPKKCGHTLGRAVIPLEEMVTKVKVAVDARQDADFLIIARSDARTTHGLDAALERAAAYRAAGADVIFLESPESEAEMQRVAAEIDAPLVANMVEGGRTPLLPQARLAELGFALAIYPASGFLAAGKILREVYGSLRRDGDSGAVKEKLESFDAFNEMIGFPEVWDFDRRHGSGE